MTLPSSCVEDTSLAPRACQEGVSELDISKKKSVEADPTFDERHPRTFNCRVTLPRRVSTTACETGLLFPFPVSA